MNNKILNNNDDFKGFLIGNEIIIETKFCTCGQIARLILYRQSGSERLIYRCTKKGCQRKLSILKTKIPQITYVSVLFWLMCSATYWQISIWSNVTDQTINKIRKKLRWAYVIYMNRHPVVLGGPDIIVQADESVLSRRGIISNPSSTSDDTPSTVWILGAVDENKNFIIKRVPNRQSETLRTTLEGVVRVGSILCTDGYPSYPSVAANLSCLHRIVNHSEGFVSQDGTHTNNIESFWSHLKSTMRKENGVMRANIDEWLAEYTFKRRYIIGETREEFLKVFIEILKIIINE